MSNFARAQMVKAFLGLLFAGLIFIIVWAVLLRFLPDGWWIMAINIIGFLLSLFIIGMGSWQTLKAFMPSILAFILGVVIWFIMAVVIRSFILDLLGVI